MNANERKYRIVIPAWIAGIQMPWMATPNYIPVFWIPAIHAGMTTFLIVVVCGIYSIKDEKYS